MTDAKTCGPKERRFFDALRDLFIGAKVDGQSGYINLMQARYGSDRLAIETKVDDAVADSLVPPFIVQPLLENSIKHGMREIGTLHVSLCAYPIEGGIALQVTDDGVGMDEETRASLFDPARRTQRSSDRGAGLALTNVLARIHFFFGSSSHIDVESTQDVGTKVTIVLLGEPRETQMGEVANVERSHRR